MKRKLFVKNQKILVIPIEIKFRELLHKLLLTYSILQKTNFSVVLGGQRYLNNKYNYENCIYFDKNTNPTTREKYPIYKKNKVLMLDEEGPVHFLNNNIFKERYYFKNLNKQINYYFFAGKNDLKKINKKNIKKKSFISGHPKFDLLKKRFSKFHERECKIIKKKYKNFILITGHSWFNSWNPQRIEGMSKYVLKESKTSLKKHSNLRKKNWHIRHKNYIKLLELTKKIAIENPKLTVLFRKHPLEDKKMIKDYFKKRPKNLKLVYEFAITPWIKTCDIHIHAGCMTSLESAFLDKTQIVFMPHIDETLKKLQLSNYVFKKPEQCINFLKKNYIKPNFKKKILFNSLINYQSNYFSCDLISKFLNSKFSNMKNSEIYLKLESNKISFKLKKFLMTYGSKLKSFLNKFSTLRSIFGRFSPKNHFITREIKIRKFDYLSANEIKRNFKILDKIQRKQSKFKIKKIDESVFLIKNTL